MVQLEREEVLWARGLRHVAGVDEAGRGPLAGPVVAAAVMVAPGFTLAGLDDSKRLRPRAREALAPLIMEGSLAWAVAVVDVAYIDRHNIAQATFDAMRQAVFALTPAADAVLVDGFPCPGLGLPQEGIPGGDGLSVSIAAASVLAKVHRDRLMVEYARQYPGYGFEVHKGYPTRDHREALVRLGACPLHRTSFTLLPAGGA